MDKNNTGSLDTYVEDIKSVLDDIESYNITCSKSQTKEWRKSQKWYTSGKSNECEIYQRKLIEFITQQNCIKSLKRINIETLEIKDNVRPLKNMNGFEWTENFDGYQSEPFNIYYNLKMVCDSGGAQTRSLREVYHFVKTQLEYLLNVRTTDVYFINILDGNESYKHKDKFSYLKKNIKYDDIAKYVFIGDMLEFSQWYRDLSKDNL